MIQDTLLKYMNIAFDLHSQDRFAEAEKVYRPLRRAYPANPEINRLLGLAIGQQGRHKEALRYIRKSVAVAPENHLAWANLAQVLAANGDYDEARGACETALALDPALDNAKYVRGMIELAKGDWHKGWQDYEAGIPAGLRNTRYVENRWRGGPLSPNDVLLLHSEQGLGDTIQFCRFVHEARQWAGCKVIVEVQQELLDLLRDIPGADAVIGSQEGQYVAHDYQCPLMSLPYIFGLRQEQLTGLPYLRPKLTHLFDREVGKYGGIPIGFLWKGNPKHPNDLNRSIKFGLWADVLATEPYKFHSLMLKESQHDFKTVDELAGLMANMGLIITVDTAVAHLAGAMGIPCWLLLAHVPDWRWGLKGETTPWYQSARLFRQTEPGNWKEVLDRVKSELMAVAPKEIIIGR